MGQFHPFGVGKWVPASAGKAKAGMVSPVSGWTWGVQVKLWDPLRTRAIPERLRGVFTTRRYTNPRLPYLTLPQMCFLVLRTRAGLLTLTHFVTAVMYQPMPPKSASKLISIYCNLIVDCISVLSWMNKQLGCNSAEYYRIDLYSWTLPLASCDSVTYYSCSLSTN